MKFDQENAPRPLFQNPESRRHEVKCYRKAAALCREEATVQVLVALTATTVVTSHQSPAQVLGLRR